MTRRNLLTIALWTERSAQRDRLWIARRLKSVPLGERTNALTHAIAAIVFGLLGTALVLANLADGSLELSVGLALFTASLLLLYGASALYHAEADPKRKAALRILDHCSIYVLIAGSYSPFAMDLGGERGAFLMLCIWTLAAVGAIFKVLGRLKSRVTSLLVYVFMGWSVVFMARPFIAHFDQGVLLMLVLGGVAYTLGTPFYALSQKPYMHAVWHMFVILGSTFHVIAAASLVQF